MLDFVKNYIYFYHLDKFCIIPVTPDQITDNMNSNFQQTNALSRSAPVFTYTNSGPRNVSIQLRLHRDTVNEINKYNISFLTDDAISPRTETGFNDLDYTETLVRYLQAAALPKYVAYNASIAGVVPPMVAVRFGEQLFIKGVITSGVQLTYEKPVNQYGKYACAYVNITISEVDPYDAQTVAQAGSFRGLTASSIAGSNDIFSKT